MAARKFGTPAAAHLASMHNRKCAGSKGTSRAPRDPWRQHDSSKKCAMDAFWTQLRSIDYLVDNHGNSFRRADEQDWSLFTSYILLASVSYRLIVEEIDALIARGVNKQQLEDLLNLRKSIAGYAMIEKLYKEGGGK